VLTPPPSVHETRMRLAAATRRDRRAGTYYSRFRRRGRVCGTSCDEPATSGREGRSDGLRRRHAAWPLGAPARGPPLPPYGVSARCPSHSRRPDPGRSKARVFGEPREPDRPRAGSRVVRRARTPFDLLDHRSASARSDEGSGGGPRGLPRREGVQPSGWTKSRRQRLTPSWCSCHSRCRRCRRPSGASMTSAA